MEFMDWKTQRNRNVNYPKILDKSTKSIPWIMKIGGLTSGKPVLLLPVLTVQRCTMAGLPLRVPYLSGHQSPWQPPAIHDSWHSCLSWYVTSKTRHCSFLLAFSFRSLTVEETILWQHKQLCGEAHVARNWGLLPAATWGASWKQIF